MLYAERLTLPEVRAQLLWPEPAGIPPRLPVAADGLSGRPRCRIFPVGRLWVLQLETAGGWLAGPGALEPPPRIRFATLAAAINHAILHGYDYRIITPEPIAQIAEHARRRAPSKRHIGSPIASKTEH